MDGRSSRTPGRTEPRVTRAEMQFRFRTTLLGRNDVGRRQTRDVRGARSYEINDVKLTVRTPTAAETGSNAASSTREETDDRGVDNDSRWTLTYVMGRVRVIVVVIVIMFCTSWVLSSTGTGAHRCRYNRNQCTQLSSRCVYTAGAAVTAPEETSTAVNWTAAATDCSLIY